MKLSLAGLALISVLGCGAPPTRSTADLVVDLATQMDRAEILTETSDIDFGSTAARVFLGDGWFWNEQEPSGTTFVWSTRYSSEVYFFTVDTDPRTVRFRCKPLRRGLDHVESLSIRLNDSSLSSVPLRKGWHEYKLVLSGDSLRQGVNRLVFEYSRRHGLEKADKKRGKRQVAVAWDWLRFPTASSGAQPATTAQGSLTLPGRSRIDLYFDTPAPAELVIDKVVPAGPGGRLEISSLLDGEVEVAANRKLEVIESAEDLRFQINTGPGLARLRLLATGDFELSRPRLVMKGRAPKLTTTSPAPFPTPGIRRVRPSLILLYLIDTLRADHLTIYNEELDTSPGLARLMADGVVFADAVAQSSWTKPTTASILTGRLPWSHGVETAADALTGELESLAHALRGNGYRTAGFSANGNISHAFGFHHGFDHFSLMGEFDAPSTTVQNEALDWLRNEESTPEVFLYLHTIDPHAPYAPTERFFSRSAKGSTESPVGSVPFMRQLAKSRQEPAADMIQQLLRMYDGEIAFSDQQFTDLLEELKKSGLYDSSLILVMSDHGEEFYDHGNWTHGRTLHQEVLRIPLLIKFPEDWAAGTRVLDTAQQIDILPTLLDYLEISRPPGLPGSSLLCSIQQSLSPTGLDCDTSQPRPAFSSVHYFHNHWTGVIVGDWKLIQRSVERLDRQAMLFDRRVDPLEQHNLAALHPVRVGYLASLIRAEIEKPTVEGASRAIELDEETRDRLEALGYLN